MSNYLTQPPASGPPYWSTQPPASQAKARRVAARGGQSYSRTKAHCNSFLVPIYLGKKKWLELMQGARLAKKNLRRAANGLGAITYAQL